MRAMEFTQPRAAGCIIRAEDTGRWCLQQRSDSVSDPGIWSTWGGGREPGETLEQTVRRELEEEGGYTGPLRLEPLLMIQRYATYIGHVPHEFEPRLNSESQDSCWVEAGSWPSPMHPGLKVALVKLQDDLSETINPDVTEPGWHAEKLVDIPNVGRLLLQAKNIQADRPPQFVVDVVRDDGKKIGYFRFVVKDWEPQPRYKIFSKFKKQPDPYVIGGNVSVWDEYQKKGIARTVYQWVKSLGNDLRASSTQTAAGQRMWAGFADNPLEENFADGKNPGRKGLSRRVGIPKKASLSKLQKIASSSTGERRRMAQWQLNMRRGKARKNK